MHRVFLLISAIVSTAIAITTISNQPVLWRSANVPITSGHNEFHLLIKFRNPCEILTNETVHVDLLSVAKQRCEELYEEYFIKELEEMCPTGSYTEVHSRQRRFIFSLLIGVGIAAIIAAVGLGISTTITSSINTGRIDNLESKMEIIDRKLEQASRELNLATAATTILQENVSTMDKRLIYQEKDLSELKTKQIGSIFAISYITTRLLLANHIIKETKRQWADNKVYPPFFDYLNYTMPCGQSCPLKFAKGRNCRLSFDKTKLLMDFTTPIVNETLRLAEADSFELMHQTNNLTCSIKYTGPSNAIISTNQDCVYSVNVKHSNLILSPSQDCKSVAALPDTSKYFALDKCRPRQEHDAWDFVQIKQYNNQNHIYCAGNNITIGKISQPCPNQTFIMPDSAEFHINDNFYKVGEYKINHQEEIDPLFTLRANWFLQPKLHMDEILADIPLNKIDISELTPNNTFHVSHTVLIAIALTLLTILAIAATACFYVKKYKKSHASSRINNVMIELE
jgi:hypothetical protein